MKRGWPLPTKLELPVNRAVSTVVASHRLCMHSDLADPLSEIDRHLSGRGVGSWFPSAGEYSYELRHTESGVVFLIGYGMRGISLRLSPVDEKAALDAGAQPDALFGPGWFAFECFASGREVTLRDWSQRALSAAEVL